MWRNTRVRDETTMSARDDEASRSTDHGERSQQGPLPDYYPSVAADIVRMCRPPDDGICVDLGAGEGPVALALAELCSARLVLVDPDPEPLSAARDRAQDDGHARRISTLCGRAEQLPLTDQSVDVVFSRGSVYFWENQARGVAEIYRVLRVGGQAMIGGGLGHDYPEWARREFVRRRHEGARSKGPEAYARFVYLRDPKTFASWARAAGLPRFEVVGEGGRPPEDPSAGLGIWLRFER